MLFTCIKSWFFRNYLANFHQISHWSFCWNVIDSLFKWSCPIDCQAHIFFFKTKNYSNDDIFISCDDRIGKNVAWHLHVCSGYVTQVSEPWPVGLLFLSIIHLSVHTFIQSSCKMTKVISSLLKLNRTGFKFNFYDGLLKSASGNYFYLLNLSANLLFHSWHLLIILFTPITPFTFCLE